MYQFNIYYLRFFTTVLAALSFLNILYSYYFNLYLNVNTYFYTFLICLIPIISFFFKLSDIKKVSIYYKIQTIILGYFFLPIIISLPYYFSIYNISFIDAYFEAISGFTSTGFTIFENIKHLDESLIIWRSSSQWIGGLYFLFSIIYLIDIYDSSFNSGIDPGEASIGRMLVRYIADSLMGHPFAQAFIANEKEIIDTVNSSNLHLQITTSLLNNLTTTDYSDNEICLSVIEQFIENAPSRFLNEVEGEIYNFPFCKGDYITLFVKMSCDINLSEITGKGFNTNIYQTLNESDARALEKP